MKNKQIIISCIVTAVLTAVLMSMFYFSPLGAQFIGAASNSSVSKSYGKMMMIEKYIDDNYTGKYSPDMLVDSALHNYVAALNDPYSSYFNKREFETLNQQLGGEYRGIGVTVAGVDGRIVIAGVEKDSPAKRAGVKKDDILLKVNGKEYTAASLRGATDAIKATPEGKEVVLNVERNGEVMDIAVPVENIVKKSVEYTMLPEKIGYIYISGFVSELSEEFSSAVDSLKDSGAGGFVIDLRDNPGGTFDAAIEVADMLLPECTIVTAKNKHGYEEVYKSDKDMISEPVVVLVNENSASASEVLSGALRDNGRASLVGKKTFGKGVVQSVIGFGDGSGFSLTVAKYYTPSGVCINGIGIEPDIEVSQNEDFIFETGEIKEDDIQLNTAVDTLKNSL